MHPVIKNVGVRQQAPQALNYVNSLGKQSTPAIKIGVIVFYVFL